MASRSPVSSAASRSPVISTGRGVSPRRLARAQRKTLVSGMLVFVVLIVLLQLWLLTATMNAFLGGDTGVALPAALASAACFGLNLGLLRYLFRFE